MLGGAISPEIGASIEQYGVKSVHIIIFIVATLNATLLITTHLFKTFIS